MVAGGGGCRGPPRKRGGWPYIRERCAPEKKCY